ncbi:hypothetical protein DVH24_000739 [Malus domestica]|uniref:Uncharacterized protein n=1 Tax=Malus domestica TaxID=3750 RepID=A0A498K3H6_MALDO|nr:hypothetical protein DVH24_000739 [Malus domestica]
MNLAVIELIFSAEKLSQCKEIELGRSVDCGWFKEGGETELLAKENGGHCSGLGGWKELEEVSEFEAERGELDSDDISLFSAHKIWIDHCSFSFCADGLIDAIMRYQNHDFQQLLCPP